MSYSIHIPLEYLLDEQQELKENIQPYCQTIQTDGSSNTRKDGCLLILGYNLDNRYQLHFITDRDECGEEYLLSATFTGFYNSCQEVIKLLGLPEDTEIQ